jgi:hypothetical protein
MPMLKKSGLAALSALVLAGMAAVAPASAQGFSVTIGNGYPGYYRPPPPPVYYAPPPVYAAPVYGGPVYSEYAPPPRRRCWDRPVDVWNGFNYVTRVERVCR